MKHFSLDSDLTDNLTGANPDPFGSVTEWKGSTEVDFTRQSAHTRYQITGMIDSDVETYVVGKWQYLRSYTPRQSWPPSRWTRTESTDTTWPRATQLPYYLEVLRTAQTTVLAGNDNVSGVDCYVLEVAPSRQAMVDWIVAQDQPVGPQFEFMNGGGTPLIRANAYRSGSVRLWIDKQSFRISKVQIDAEFEGAIRLDTPDETFVERLEATVYFYGYDDTTRIELPADVQP